MAFPDRKNTLLQPAPILSFWDLKDVHVVDFGDRAAESATTAGTVRFDGVDYTPAELSISERAESTEGGESDVVVAIADPTGAIATALQTENGYSGERVTLRRIYYDRIGDPSQAEMTIFIVRAPTCTDEGIAFSLASPALVETKIPRRTFSRTACWNNYHLRHQLGNRCSMPSDWFTARTKQRFKNTFIGAGVHGQRFGWSSANTNFATRCQTGYTAISSFLKLCMEIRVSVPCGWRDATQTGPFVFKRISGDFDVETRVSELGTVRDDHAIGLLAQGDTTLDDWVMFGAGAGVDLVTDRNFRFRVTRSASSTTYDFPRLASHDELRLRRVGNIFTAFHKSPNDAGWEEVRSEDCAMSSTVRLGFAMSSDSSVTAEYRGHFARFHVTAGGPATCDRTLAQCTAYENTNDYNGFAEMPDVRANV
jgi:phage-related protein